MTKATTHYVLLPGMDGTGQLFQPFIARWPDPAQVTVIHYPVARYLSLTALPDYIVPQLPANQRLVIIAESYSGPVALQLAARTELAIDAVVLVATFARFPAGWLRRLATSVPLSWLFRLPIPDFVLRYYCLGQDADTGMLELLRASLQANQPDILAQRVRDIMQVDVTEHLAKITMPCLYLAASNDRLVSLRTQQLLRTHLPQMKVVTVNGPHFLLQANPSACVAAIDEFITATVKRMDL